MYTFLSVLGCLAEGEGEEEGYGDLVRLNWVLLFPTIFFLEIIRQSMEKGLGMGAISALCKEMNSKSHWILDDQHPHMQANSEKASRTNVLHC